MGVQILLIFNPYQRGQKVSSNSTLKFIKQICTDVKCSQCHKTPYFSVPPTVVLTHSSYGFISFAAALALEVK